MHLLQNQRSCISMILFQTLFTDKIDHFGHILRFLTLVFFLSCVGYISVCLSMFETQLSWMSLAWTLCTNPSRWIIPNISRYFSLWMFVHVHWCWLILLGPTLGLPLAAGKSLDSISLGLLGLTWAYRANQRILGFRWSGPTGPTMGLPWQRAHPWIPLLWA